MSGPIRRRTVLRTAGVALAGAVAGCGGGSDDGAASPTDDGGDESPTEPSPTDTATPTPSQPSVSEFLSGTSNFDGIEDATGTDAVGVEVGVEANGAYYGFSPAAVRIDQGATVTWTWTGQGGTHNVVARHGADFRSEQSAEDGYTFEHTFEEPGTALYVCVPHEGLGMKGAVVVE